jgi:hypothetical protein
MKKLQGAFKGSGAIRQADDHLPGLEAKSALVRSGGSG